MQTHNERMRSLSRRDALRLAAGAGAAGLLAACGGGSATSTSPPSQATSGAGAPTTSTVGSAPAAATAPASAVSIAIPTTSAKLPTDKVNFHWVDSGDVKAFFWNAYFLAYQRAHPNITVQYDALPWNEIAKVVPLGVQNGNAPDVFQIPLGFTAGQAVSQGWVQPLDDIIPDFANWKKGFPTGSFANGVTDFNGKTYQIPFTTNKRHDLLLYNVDYLKQAGIDPQAKRLTWDEFRAAAKKLTQQGAGKYYGTIIGGNQTNQWEAFVRVLAQIAGAPGSSEGGLSQDTNYKTGEYNFTTDQYLAAIDLLLGMKADGSIFPGSSNLNAPQARAQMPQGAAGMMLQGIWNIPQWIHDNPTYNFDIADLPVPNTGTPLPLFFGPGGGNALYVFAKSKNAQIAGDIFHYLGTTEGQTQWATITGGSDPPNFPQVIEQAQVDPRDRKALGIFNQTMHLAPSPNVRNPDWSQADLEKKTLSPDFGQVLQGVFTGQVSDAKKAMQDLKDRADKELDRSLKAAQAKGAKVSRDDLAFPNWDPTKDYTDADYAALKK
ncbi:MAG: ABC transporter substrate-binding protein [Thermomicrobiales bacterium]